MAATTTIEVRLSKDLHRFFLAVIADEGGDDTPQEVLENLVRKHVHGHITLAETIATAENYDGGALRDNFARIMKEGGRSMRAYNGTDRWPLNEDARVPKDLESAKRYARTRGRRMGKAAAKTMLQDPGD